MLLIPPRQGESGSSPADSARARLRSLPSFAGFERLVSAGAPPAAAGGDSPPVSSRSVTSDEPSVWFGCLLDGQIGTVSRGFHRSAQRAYRLESLSVSGLKVAHVSAHW